MSNIIIRFREVVETADEGDTLLLDEPNDTVENLSDDAK